MADWTGYASLLGAATSALVAFFAISGQSRDAASRRHAAARESALGFAKELPEECLEADLRHWPSLRRTRRLQGVDARWIKFEAPEWYSPFAMKMFEKKWMPRWLGLRFLDWFGYLGEYIPWSGDPRLHNHIPLALPVNRAWRHAESMLEGQEFGDVTCPGCAAAGFEGQWKHLAFVTSALEAGVSMHHERMSRLVQNISVYAILALAIGWIIASWVDIT